MNDKMSQTFFRRQAAMRAIASFAATRVADFGTQDAHTLLHPYLDRCPCQSTISEKSRCTQNVPPRILLYARLSTTPKLHCCHGEELSNLTWGLATLAILCEDWMEESALDRKMVEDAEVGIGR